MGGGDEGFEGYVPQTVDPGPMLLVATVLIGLLLLISLPIAVVMGDKYEELEKRANNSYTDDDEEADESKEGSKAAREMRLQLGDDCASIASKSTYRSAISGVVLEVLDNTGKPTRSGGHRRHKRRNRHHLERNTLLQDPGQYSIEFTAQNFLDGSSCKDGASTANKAESSKKGSTFDDEFSAASKHDHDKDMSDCGTSDHGGVEIKARDLQGYDMPLNSRNVCLTAEGFLDEMAAIMAWDVETKRIIKLCIPFATQAIFTGTLDTLTVGVIGKLIGTREQSAYVVANLLIEITTQFVGGFHEALATLCSQAIGANKPRLAGKYVQIATILYTLSYVPFALLWAFYLGAAIEWFGFDEETVRIGQQYGYLLLVDLLIDGLGESVHGLLDVAGFENYSTFIGALEELLAFLIILIWALVGSPSLFMVGLVQFGMGVLFLSLNIFIIWWKGWFRPYRSGMIGTFALSDTPAVWLVCKTAMSLAFGYLLTDGEWELLTVFASFLGPAEVAAWGIFGTIWDAVNELMDGISDASEIRCAFLLGSDQPERARLSAYKSLMICTFTSLFITSALFTCGEDLPVWLTNDPTLQHLLRDLLPMFGLGNGAMCISSMAWTLLGSQGRYRLATVVVFLVSWFVTLPLAAVLSVYLQWNLEGQTATVVVGYMLAGTIHAYYLFRSDWFALSQSVIDDNCSRASDETSLKNVPTKPDSVDGELARESRGTEANEEAFGDEGQEVLEAQPQANNITANETVDHAVDKPVSRELSKLPASPSRRNLFYKRCLPIPPSGDGDIPLFQPVSVAGEWTGAGSEGLEVELFSGS